LKSPILQHLADYTICEEKTLEGPYRSSEWYRI